MIIVKKNNNDKLTVGIDLGTTYSLIATINRKKPILLMDNKKRILLPSIVYYQKNKILVGWEAQKKIIKDSANTISSVKRFIGRSIIFIKKKFPILPYIISEDKEGDIIFNTNFGKVTPVDISSEILKKLKERISLYTDKNISATVITIPAYFNDVQRKQTKKAALISDINIIRLINEPTAAAIAYGLLNKKKGLVAVYDLGGGTFDISFLQLKKGIYEVLATGGDSHLGGDDLDFLLAEYIYKKSKMVFQCNSVFQSLLLDIAKQTKIKLTKQKIVKIHLFNWTGYITRDEFNLIVQKLIKKTLLICQNIMKEINLNIEQIKEVILVGGSTRIPIIVHSVTKFFQKIPLNSINPDEVVAIGAAIQADMLFGQLKNKKTILLDVVPLSLGIEVIGGFFEKIINRNTTIPISITKEFTTFQDGQTKILIHVLQGERTLVKDCFSLSRFVLKGLPSRKAGIIRIFVKFEINTEGLISITAFEKESGLEKKVYISKNLKLEPTEINKIISDAISHSSKDYIFKVKEEKKTESYRILKILKEALKNDHHLLSKEEKRKIINKKNELKKSLDLDDFFEINKSLNSLEKASKRFFLLRIKKSLHNHFIKNITDEIQ